jgi:tetratricopeptide (TPR) repeat protein
MGVPVIALLLFQAFPGSDDSTTAAVRIKAGNPSLPASDRATAYEQLIRNSPSDHNLYADYASLLIANRDYTSALKWITKGLAVTPSDTGLRVRQGIALHATNQHEASLRILEALPASGESRFYMGLDYRALGNHTLAQKYLAEASDLGLRDPYALYALIEEDHALRDKAAGLRHFELFMKEFPDSPWLHVLYANAYMQKDKSAEARREYQEALRLKPDLPAVNFRLGYLLYQDREYVAAAECFRKELALNPSYSDANLFLGQALRTLGRQDEAIGYFRNAIALDAKSDLAYRALAGILTDQGHLSEAAEILRRAESQFPSDPGFPAQLAKILSRLNREEEALKEQEKFRLLKQSERSREKSIQTNQ